MLLISDEVFCNNQSVVLDTSSTHVTGAANFPGRLSGRFYSAKGTLKFGVSVNFEV